MSVQEKPRFEDHMRLVWMCVHGIQKKNYLHDLDPDDLFQVGCIGLMKAIDNFDPTLGCAFSTYAVIKISGEIRREIRDYGYSIRTPRHARRHASLIRSHRLEDKTPEFIAAYLKITVGEAERALEITQLRLSSINSVTFSSNDDDELRLEDMLFHLEDFTAAEINEFISSLNDREKLILQERLEGKAQTEIANIVGVSQTHIYRILRQIGQKYLEYSAA